MYNFIWQVSMKLTVSKDF